MSGRFSGAETGRASQLVRGFEDWRQIVLQMMLPDRLTAIVAGLQVDPRFETDKERVRRFIEETGMSRPTYYRIKRRLSRSICDDPQGSQMTASS